MDKILKRAMGEKPNSLIEVCLGRIPPEDGLRKNFWTFQQIVGTLDPLHLNVRVFSYDFVDRMFLLEFVLFHHFENCVAQALQRFLRCNQMPLTGEVLMARREAGAVIRDCGKCDAVDAQEESRHLLRQCGGADNADTHVLVTLDFCRSFKLREREVA